MASQAIINAAPLTILLGTQDISGRVVPREPEAIPTHCAKSFIYAKKGPSTPQLVVGGSRTQMYHADSFDLRMKWANHATLFSNGINAEGNAHVIERLIPTDAGPAANLTLWVELVESEIDDYERNLDGSIKIVANAPVVKSGGPIVGHKMRWYVTRAKTAIEAQSFGAQNETPGTVLTGTIGVTPTVSRCIPIVDFKMSYIGEDGNNTGIRLWAPTTKTTGAYDKRLLTRDKVFPIRMGVIRRNEKTQIARFQETKFGEQTILTTFKPNVISSITDEQLSFDDVFLNFYQNLTDPVLPPLFGEFGETHTYDENIADLLTILYEKEKEYVDDNRLTAVPAIKTDFPAVDGVVDEDKWLFNFVSAQSSEAYPYHTLQMSALGTDTVRPTEFINIFAGGGSDGTMNDQLFADLVAERMEVTYGDENSKIHNTAINVESIIYDSGFPLDTKYALTYILAHRKDTFCALGTHEVGGMRLTASQENSMAVALRTRLQLFPESEYFGTHVMRGLVMGRSGKIRNSQWKKDISPLYEVAVKSARYMGAGNGKWKPGFHFDGAPGSILTSMYDINVSYTSAATRNLDWDAGLNWVQDFDRRGHFFPALKTVFNDDTSVLNSYFTAMIIVEINKVCERAWRYYSGVSNLTDEQLAERVDRFIVENTRGRFDNRVIIEPTTYYTDADKARGYSWTTRVKLYANNMKTVMTAYVQSERMSAYTAPVA